MHSASAFLLLQLLFLVARPASAVSSHHEIMKRHVGARQLSSQPQAVPEYNFSMPIDHFNTDDTRTYNNRYWVNDTYYKPGGPVFWMDAGEAGVTASTAMFYLGESYGPTAVMQLAQRHGGMAIFFEHRYYGYSQPFPEMMPDFPSRQLPEATPEMYKYLTMEQALEDVVYFATHFAPEGYSTEEAAALAPSQTPWIWLGGSYPGSRGLWIRSRNPEIFYAVWASSPPTENMEDGQPYYGPIEASLPRNCSADIQAVVKYVDETFGSGDCEEDIMYLKQLYYVANQVSNNSSAQVDAAGAANVDVSSIAWFLSQAFGTFQYSGPESTDRFCNFMQAYNPSATVKNDNDTTASILSILNNEGSRIATEAGIAATYDIDTAVEAYVYAIIQLEANSALFSEQGFTEAVDTTSWHHQQFTEMGWLIASNPERPTIVSKYANYTAAREYWQLYNMPAAMNATTYPDHPNVSVPLKYGGWDIKVSNAMITDGQFDPWRAFSVNSEEFDYGAPGRNLTQTVPACGQVPENEDVFGLIYEGQVHVTDFVSDSYVLEEGSPIAQGLALFGSALDVWLPCFNKA